MCLGTCHNTSLLPYLYFFTASDILQTNFHIYFQHFEISFSLIFLSFPFHFWNVSKAHGQKITSEFIHIWIWFKVQYSDNSDSFVFFIYVIHNGISFILQTCNTIWKAKKSPLERKKYFHLWKDTSVWMNNEYKAKSIKLTQWYKTHIHIYCNKKKC